MDANWWCISVGEWLCCLLVLVVVGEEPGVFLLGRWCFNSGAHSLLFGGFSSCMSFLSFFYSHWVRF